MDKDDLKSCLKTFLKVSTLQINNIDNDIRRKNLLMKKVNLSNSTVTDEIMELVEKKHKIQGQLDCVILEILDVVLENPSLISDKVLAKKGYSSVNAFVKEEKNKIELRGLYKKYPCSIEQILNIALSDSGEELEPKITKEDVKNVIDNKNVKIMIKTL